MSFLSKIIGSGVTTPVEAVGNAMDKLFTSDEERIQANAVLEKIRQKPHILQAEINKLEAQHRTVFVAGWRPAIGWICAAGLSFPFLFNPFLQWYTGNEGPNLPTESLMTLVISLLGLGGLRTAEKIAGKTK